MLFVECHVCPFDQLISDTAQSMRQVLGPNNRKIHYLNDFFFQTKFTRLT